MKLRDKVVVVTGSGTGIGEAFAHRFTEEGAKISGLPTDDLDYYLVDYYLVLANFKIGIVLERTYARNTTSDDGNREVAEAFGSMVLQSIATAADMARSLAGSVG